MQSLTAIVDIALAESCVDDSDPSFRLEYKVATDDNGQKEQRAIKLEHDNNDF